MTIRDFICKGEHAAFCDRLEKLKQIGAPSVVIEGQEKACKDLADGKIKVGGSKELLDVDYESHEIKTGNGGKKYLLFNGTIRYFPQAKYGRYITA